MRAVMVMFDTLNRRMLPPYGCEWVHAPNFSRLAARTVTFDNAYAGSLPCMPARRELHTGRYNFLHRSWGPLEPFDDSMPEMLKTSGVYTHLVSDHYHYWEEGGCNYHTRYSSWEVERGQVGDPWKGEVAEPDIPPVVFDFSHLPHWRHHWVNRKQFVREEDFPQYKVFERGMEFIRTNAGADRWFLQIETFAPHEPFHSPEKYRELYRHDYQGRHFDWPPYRRVAQTAEEVEHCRLEYAALVSMCDERLGRVLDLFDKLDLWKDTLLIVNTDHGFLLGEHGWWAKIVPPPYNEVAHLPLFMWDPRSGARGERRGSLVQTIDLPATLLEFFGVEAAPDMMGVALRETVSKDAPVREAALFGAHGGHVSVTDGRHVYMRGAASAENRPLFEYTLMPANMLHTFSVEEMRTVELREPFGFTKGCPVMKIRGRGYMPKAQGVSMLTESMLFDLAADPGQERPLKDADVEEHMKARLTRLMREHDAPGEQYQRLGLEMPPA